MQSCLRVEEQKSCLERDKAAEEWRQERMAQTVDMLRECDHSQDPKKLKQMYMYKALAMEDYRQEQIQIKSDYRQGLMDPRREVARRERIHPKKRHQHI